MTVHIVRYDVEKTFRSYYNLILNISIFNMGGIGYLILLRGEIRATILTVSGSKEMPCCFYRPTFHFCFLLGGNVRQTVLGIVLHGVGNVGTFTNPYWFFSFLNSNQHGPLYP